MCETDNNLQMQLHPLFIPQLRVLVNNITPNEERLCMMIKWNLSNHEIAQILKVSVKSVYIARARLKRKLMIEDDKTMEEWIKNIPYPELRL